MKQSNILVLSLALLTLSACAGRTPEIIKMEQAISDMRSIQSEQTTQIAALEDRLRMLSGRLEEVEYIQNRRVGGDLAQLKTDIHKITQRVPPPPIVPVMELEADEVAVQNWQSPFGEIGKKVLELIRLGRFADAEPYLSEAINMLSAEAQDYAPLLLFWRGVVGDGLGNNKVALESYVQMLAQSPDHVRAPLAMYRQAQVFIRLGDRDTASLTLKKLINDYPNSEYKARAVEKLRDL